MRILHVIPYLTVERGGPCTALQLLVTHQVAAGHTVTVLTTDQGVRQGEQPLPMPEQVNVVRVGVIATDATAYAPRFKGVFRRFVRGNDVVHLHGIFTYPSYVASREAFQIGVPTVHQPHGMLHRYSLRRSHWRKKLFLTIWGRRVRQACTAWHYTSTREANESWPWDSSPRFILPYGIEPNDYRVNNSNARELLGRHWPALAQSPYVLFMARLHPKKRLDLLLTAFLAGAPRRFKLVVAGPDECSMWENLKARSLRDASTTERVVRIGTVSGDCKIALLGCARLFALPSEHENFGIAALEAIAAGTPVLLSPHVDLADAAVANGLGNAVPIEAAAWTAMLESLLRTENKEYLRAALGRQWVTQHFSAERIAQDLSERYRWVMAGCRPNAPWLSTRPDLETSLS